MMLSRSYTRNHERLFQICLKPPPEEEYIQAITHSGASQVIPRSALSLDDLKQMERMIELEFLASYKKELEAPEDAVGKQKVDPNVFDVFLMQSTLGVRGRSVALCVPSKKKGTATRADDNGLMWYNGETLCALSEWSHSRRVASLSGTVRVLQALQQDPRDPQLELMNLCMKREGLIKAVDVTDDPVLPTVKMNMAQKQALQTVASPSFKKGFFAIQGPPGCGKTTTMVGMIAIIKEDTIVTAPSNAAVANIALKLYETRHYNLDDIVVFGDNCDKSVEFLNPILRHEKFCMFQRKLDEIGSEEIESEKIEAKKLDACKEFASYLHMDCKEDASSQDFSRQAAEICPIIDRSSAVGQKRFEQLLSKSAVVFCTLNTLGSSFLQKALQGSFQTVMLDEGGQCSEAEFFIACTFPGVKRIIVVGDPKQLGATIIDPTCKQAGLGVSWLDKVYHLYPERIHLLDYQYRMDPQILEFPNKMFYQKRIKSNESVIGRSPHVGNPFRVVDTSGRGREEKQDHSWKNVYEVAVIKNIIKSDTDILSLLTFDKSTRTIIITPYRAQAQLLKEAVGSLFEKTQVEVATVDSFQGQEGDIVIISTVRTQKIGFVDDPRRLNVALTRARRVVRIVGDVDFFKTLPHGSTIWALATFAQKENKVDITKVRTIPWCPPDWKQSTLWKPTTTSKFVSCLQNMSQAEKNVCLNTLFAVALPDFRALRIPKLQNTDRPTWIISRLCGIRLQLNIVWIGKLLHGQLCIQAHFAGTRRECLQFVQKYPEVPDGACRVKTDLSGIIETIGDSSSKVVATKGNFVMTWPVTNELQSSIAASTGDAGNILPHGQLILDDVQDSVARSSPPLIIESRSGTGKTLVLLQHAAFFSRADRTNPACFVTVSPRLRDELSDKYNKIGRIETATECDPVELPPTQFYSFQHLLFELARWQNLKEYSMPDMCCSFLEYCVARTSHRSLNIESHVIENEIGGVIMGSLVAAKQGQPLNRYQYMADKRSNISNASEHGRQQRSAIYDEYERYNAWKIKHGKFDTANIVLSILKKDPVEIFSSAYMDEIQDLSHAAIYLICNIAGKDSLHWVCAGDPAQMISPGCSFTFSGLKETMLAVQPGIESKLSRVTHLLVNYRTTIDVLLVGNAILNVAKQNFPDSIEYAHPETSKKDLGLKVVVCNWDDAFACKAIFGQNQAFIFSSNQTRSPDSIEEIANKWLKGHPFILSSLECKGLEFEDVLVAFDFDRKVWDLSRKGMDSLRMLRELYVAITRAQRRVVILCKRNVLTMVDFFKQLPYDFAMMKAKDILEEFDCETTPEIWHDRAQLLLSNGQYMLAARCFRKAMLFAWTSWCEGKFYQEKCCRAKAVEAFRQALRFFIEEFDYVNSLKTVLIILEFPPWDPDDDDIVDIALHSSPHSISGENKVRLALARNRWNDISVEDLLSCHTAHLFASHRKNMHLKNLIATCSARDHHCLKSLHPLLVGDYFFNNGEFLDATESFLNGHDTQNAFLATNQWIIDALRSSYTEGLGSQIEMVTLMWKGKQEYVQNHFTNSKLNILLEMFLCNESLEAMEQHIKDQFLQAFGPFFALHLVNLKRLSRLALYHLDAKLFQAEIFSTLQTKHKNCPLQSLSFFLEHNDKGNAYEFACKILRPLGEETILCALLDLHAKPTHWFHTITNNQMLESFVRIALVCTQMDTSQQDEFCHSYIFPTEGIGIDATTIRYCLMSRNWNLARKLTVNKIYISGSKEALHVASIIQTWTTTDVSQWCLAAEAKSTTIVSKPFVPMKPGATSCRGTRGKSFARKHNRKNKQGNIHVSNCTMPSTESLLKQQDKHIMDHRRDAVSWLLLFLQEPAYMFKCPEVVIRSKFGHGLGIFFQLHSFQKPNTDLFQSVQHLAHSLSRPAWPGVNESTTPMQLRRNLDTRHDFRLAVSQKFGFAVAAHLECVQPMAHVSSLGNLSLWTLKKFYQELKLRLRFVQGDILHKFHCELHDTLRRRCRQAYSKDNTEWYDRDARLSLLLVFSPAVAHFLWWQELVPISTTTIQEHLQNPYHSMLIQLKAFQFELSQVLQKQHWKKNILIAEQAHSPPQQLQVKGSILKRCLTKPSPSNDRNVSIAVHSQSTTIPPHPQTQDTNSLKNSIQVKHSRTSDSVCPKVYDDRVVSLPSSQRGAHYSTTKKRKKKKQGKKR